MRLKYSTTLLFAGAVFTFSSTSASDLKNGETPLKCKVIEFAEINQLNKAKLFEEYCRNDVVEFG
jgi:hypothetical protein